MSSEGAGSVRRFTGLGLSEPIPDESAILHFRHLLEDRHLGQGLFAEINEHLASQGLRLREGTIVDATIIEAPPSTKNRTGQREPEMRQVKKGSQYHFGMKLRIGVQKREEHLELAVQWQVAMKPGQRRKLEPEDPAAIGEKVKASIRAKVEHPFLDVKRLWGYAKSLPSRKRGYAIGA